MASRNQQNCSKCPAKDHCVIEWDGNPRPSEEQQDLAGRIMKLEMSLAMARTIMLIAEADSALTPVNLARVRLEGEQTIDELKAQLDMSYRLVTIMKRAKGVIVESELRRNVPAPSTIQ